MANRLKVSQVSQSNRDVTKIATARHYCLRANMEPASESTPSFSAPDSESLGKVKDAALDKAQDLFAQGKAKLDKVRHLDIYDAIACLAV